MSMFDPQGPAPQVSQDTADQSTPSQSGGGLLSQNLDQFNQHMLLTVTAINQLKAAFVLRGS